MKILVGDLGGTKALLGIAECSGEHPVFSFTYRFASADVSGPAELFGRFRHEAEQAGATLRGIAAACLAVAGPLGADGRTARFTNLPWRVDAEVLTSLLGMPVHLVNDFAAVAAGVTVAAPGHMVPLQAGEPTAHGLKLAIGAGTGLGVAAMSEAGACLHVLPSEGGHVGFAPATPLQTEFALWLAATQERATAERVISGPGLVSLYRFLAERTVPDSPDPLASADPAATIGARALADSASLARRAVDELFACYGAFAGDMALAFLAQGGVFLAGGVTQKLLPLLPASGFLAAFNAKAEHAELARRISVVAVTDPEVGLAGAAVLGAIWAAGHHCRRST